MSSQGTNFKSDFKLRANGKALSLKQPAVMGILNITPDSFYDGGVFASPAEMLRQAEKHISEGASILDIGAVSTRPGANDVTEAEELRRLVPALSLLRNTFPQTFLSVDTFRAPVALEAAELGADIINDISGGTFDREMFATVARTKLPYVLMHIQGTPATMQADPAYGNVVKDVRAWLKKQVAAATKAGIKQLILDPGFGFGKTVMHNFALLNGLHNLGSLGHPLLIGLSRKSMVNKPLSIRAAEGLNGTTVLNTIALLNGANILRVHDVKEAAEAIRLVKELRSTHLS
jgi:dihydropteroate synthase